MKKRMNLNKLLAGLIAGLFSSTVLATDPPPSTFPIQEKKLEELSNRDFSEDGKIALSIDAKKWKHAETDNFILHFQRMTEARKVVREIEYHLWYVAKALNATKEQYSAKSHVYIFEDEAQWQDFLKRTDGTSWAASYAKGDDLYLNVRRSQRVNRFNSDTLAHETTHAVVSRLYLKRRWPKWLNEGFAEYMGGASVAARKNQSTKSRQTNLRWAELSIGEMEAMTTYPEEPDKISQLYQSGEKVVRFLMNELPQEKFPGFVELILSGKNFQTAFMETYGDKYKKYEDFERDYARFQK